MGDYFRTKYSKIKISDSIKKGKRCDYLRPRGETILKIDEVYNVLMSNINFDDWLVNSVRLWPKTDSTHHYFQCLLERTLPDTPINLSCSLDCSLDTVHSRNRKKIRL